MKESTRNAVLAAVEKLGYTPDPTLSEIAHSRWQVLPSQKGTVIAWLQHKPLSEYRIYRESATKRAIELGMRVELFTHDEYPASDRLQQVLISRGIKGILLGPQLKPALLDCFDWGRFAAISCNRGHYELPIPCVLPDYFKSVMLAAKRMHELGYRKAGAALCAHETTNIDDHIRQAAWRHAAVVYGFDSIPLWTGGFNDSASFIKWVKEYEPDAVIGLHGGMKWWLLDNEIKVPERMGFCSLHLDFHPQEAISGCDNHLADIGRKAMDQIALLLRTRSTELMNPKYNVYIEPTWVEGSTLIRQTGR